MVDSCDVGGGAGLDASCDGVDDDCNDVTDEDFVEVVVSCGVGACAAKGPLVCEAGAPVSQCVAGAAGAGDVTCDGDLDVPLTGSCDALGRPGSYTLCSSTPQLWDGPRTGHPAMWTCGWCSTTGFVNVQFARAWICCVRP